MMPPYAALARLQMLNVRQCVLHAYDVFHPFHSCFFKILLFVDACHSTSVMNSALIYYWSAIRGLENTLSMFNTLHHLLDFVRFCRIFLYRWRTWCISNFALIAFLLQRQQDLAV